MALTDPSSTDRCPPGQRREILVKLLQAAAEQGESGLTVELQTFPNELLATMVESLLRDSRRSEAARQARQAALCSQKASNIAKRIANQHLIVSIAAAKQQQYVHGGSNASKASHRRQRSSVLVRWHWWWWAHWGLHAAACCSGCCHGAGNLRKCRMQLLSSVTWWHCLQYSFRGTQQPRACNMC